MPTAKKIALVKNLEQNLTSAQSVAFVNHEGLSSQQLEKLRHQIQAKGGNLQVVKNTLLALALSQDPKNRPNELNGPTAVVLAHTDPVAPLKELNHFIKEFELPKIKGGMLQGDFISAEKVQELAKLPTREELLAKVAGGVQGPLLGMVCTPQAILRSLIYTLAQIKAKQQGG